MCCCAFADGYTENFSAGLWRFIAKIMFHFTFLLLHVLVNYNQINRSDLILCNKSKHILSTPREDADHQSWRFGAVGSEVGRINEVTLRRARLVLGWVTVSTPGAGNLSQSNQPPRLTQPGHLFVGMCNEYRPKGSNALRLGVKADMVLFKGNTV